MLFAYIRSKDSLSIGNSAAAVLPDNISHSATIPLRLAAFHGTVLQPNKAEGELMTLHAQDGKKYKINDSDIPIWGDAVVYDTRQAALNSLDPDDDNVDLQFVRLVLVADTNLLKRLCIASKEIVRSAEAGLYLKVARTCPAYYAMWEEDSTETTHHEVYSYLKRTSKREALLNAFIDKAGGVPAPARLGVFKGIDGATPGVVMRVNPGVSVVRKGWCDESSAGGGAGSEGRDVDSNGVMEGHVAMASE